MAVLICGCLSSCAEVEEKEEHIILVDRKIDEITYNLDEVSIGDVEKNESLNSEYVQTKAQEVSFPFGGKIVDKVYVREGDTVKPGDILVELKSENLEEQILDVEYEISRATLQMSFLDSSKEYDLWNAHNSLIHSKLSGEDYCRYNDEVAEIERRYKYRTEDYLDTINFANKKLAKLQDELASKRICATINGTIMSVKRNLEGTVAKRDDVIMTVVDNSNGLFEVKDEKIKDFIKDGDILTLTIMYGAGKGEYEVTPYEINSWGEKQLFSIISAPDSSSLEVGVSGTIKAPIDKKENVLRMPINALYEADGKYYTYVLDEDNMRKVQFIEVGLIGDNYVEIISGLSEKEKVIKK